MIFFEMASCLVFFPLSKLKCSTVKFHISIALLFRKKTKNFIFSLAKLVFGFVYVLHSLFNHKFDEYVVRRWNLLVWGQWQLEKLSFILMRSESESTSLLNNKKTNAQKLVWKFHFQVLATESNHIERSEKKGVDIAYTCHCGKLFIKRIVNDALNALWSRRCLR